MRCKECKRDIGERLHDPKCKSKHLYQGQWARVLGRNNGDMWVGAQAGYDPNKVYGLDL